MVNGSGKTASSTTTAENLIQSAPPRVSELRHIARIFFRRPLAVIGLVIIIALVFTAILAPVIAPYGPDEMNILNKLKPPSSEHLLGTDSLGRDTLSRVIYGSQISLMIGFGAIGMATVLGISLGMLAGYYGGVVHLIIMRLIDCLMSLPMIVFALVIAALLGGGVKNVIIALGVGMIAAPCRVMCGVTMSIKLSDYILAAKATGVNDFRVMIRHILTNSFPPLVVVVTVGIGATILAEAGLSFLGVGIVPPTPAWGGMVNDGYKFLLTSPILSIAPGVAIMLVVFAFNMVGDGLRDALDPRLRGVI